MELGVGVAKREASRQLQSLKSSLPSSMNATWTEHEDAEWLAANYLVVLQDVDADASSRPTSPAPDVSKHGGPLPTNTVAPHCPASSRVAPSPVAPASAEVELVTHTHTGPTLTGWAKSSSPAVHAVAMLQSPMASPSKRQRRDAMDLRLLTDADAPMPLVSIADLHMKSAHA